METTKNLEFVKDIANKKITVIRYFDAPRELVWRAWTEKEWLDQWWAPKPWKAVTKSLDFKVGGTWIYAMTGPENEKQWCRVNFSAIEKPQRYAGEDFFCDENGVRNNELPGMNWNCEFTPAGSGTQVTITVTFNSEDDLRKIVEMGFQEGFASAMTNLDPLLAK